MGVLSRFIQIIATVHLPWCTPGLSRVPLTYGTAQGVAGPLVAPLGELRWRELEAHLTQGHAAGIQDARPGRAPPSTVLPAAAGVGFRAPGPAQESGLRGRQTVLPATRPLFPASWDGFCVLSPMSGVRVFSLNRREEQFEEELGTWGRVDVHSVVPWLLPSRSEHTRSPSSIRPLVRPSPCPG